MPQYSLIVLTKNNNLRISITTPSVCLPHLTDGFLSHRLDAHHGGYKFKNLTEMHTLIKDLPRFLNLKAMFGCKDQREGIRITLPGLLLLYLEIFTQKSI